MSKSHKVATVMTSRWMKWVVLAAWVVGLSMFGPLAGKLQGAESNDASTWLPAKAESTEVLNALNRFEASNLTPAVIVYNRADGLSAADRTKITADATQYTSVEHVVRKVAGPVFSSDGQAAEIVLAVDPGKQGYVNIAPVADKFSSIANTNKDAQLHMYVAGPVGIAADSSKAFKGIDGTLLFAALGVVTVLLLVTYRSPLLWLLPVFSAGVALTCAQGLIYLLAKHAGLTVNAQSGGILTVLVFGASTDYALLLIARYREELHRYKDRHEAMALALHRAGPAIIASASTVVVGMLCLLVAQLNSTKGLGPVSAIGIGVGLLVMISLLPVLLVVFGRWLFWPLVPRFGDDVPSSRGVWAKIGRGIARRPRTIWIGTTVVLLLCTLGLTALHANGLSNDHMYRTTQNSVIGQQIVTKHFPAAGAGQPVVVISKASGATAVRQALAGVQGITSITQPVVKGDRALIEATLTAEPDGTAAFDTIKQLRTAIHAVPDAAAQAGGFTAINLDTEQASRRDSRVVIPLVLFVVLVILALLLRSLVAPVVLIATVVLSFAATLGICGILFTHVWHFGGADSSFPLFAFVFLVALGIDYNIFLMTRIREETVQAGTRRAARIGLRTTGAVITSAGLVLAGTFSVLATLPLTGLAEIGIAVGLGVLLDTFIVRSVLVTALTLDIGRWMWWPSKLFRTEGTTDDTQAKPTKK